MRNPIIVALDVPKVNEALELAEELGPFVGAFKIGKQLFVGEGPDVVRKLKAKGAQIFLDLKFHDIPNTVAKACLLYTSPSPRDRHKSRMPSSA